MMKVTKYKNKYRIKSTRLENWDYGWNASYFVTICTQDRICFFGDVVDGEMQLNHIGKIVENEWLKTFEMRPDMNLEMGEYVVMPNHFHAIIGIGKNEYNTHHSGDAMHCVSTSTATMHCVSATNENNDPNNPSKNKFGPQSKNLASIIRGFKIGVTKNARLINPDFSWQPRYHDHIVRNDRSFQNITKYIIDNPKNWSPGKFK